MSSNRVIVFNMYFAKAGASAEVLATRREATRIRLALGLPAGRILHLIEGTSGLPAVLWECDFRDTAAHDEDMAGRGASPEFAAVRKRMNRLLTRFERTVWSEEQGTGEAWVAGERASVTVLNAYHPLAGNHHRVLAQRVHASEVRQALGHPAGRTLSRVSPLEPGEDGTLPQVLWQMNYPDLPARSSDFEAVTAAAEFQEVTRTMRGLLSRFGRGIWKNVPVD